MIKTPAEKTEILSRLGLTVEVQSWADYNTLNAAKLAADGKWERVKQTVTLHQKTALVALVLNLIAENQILSQAFIDRINQELSTVREIPTND